LTEIRETFGDPRNYVLEDGTLDAMRWESEYLYRIALPPGIAIPLSWDKGKKVTHWRVHKLLAPIYQSLFKAMTQAGLWDEVKTFGGTYAYRTKRSNGGDLSAHAWGIAVDLNPGTNQMGTKGDMDRDLIKAFESAGFYWGGRFRNPDPMHFQYCRGY
jgi:hypothetical protein